MAIPAGERNKRITIQSNVTVAQPGTVATPVYQDLKTVWASIKALSLSDQLVAEQVDPVLTHVVTILNKITVTSDMRLKYGTRLFNVQSAIPSDDEVDLVITCRESLEGEG